MVTNFFGGPTIVHALTTPRLFQISRYGKRRSLPPSRAKYEASHPAISVRVSRDLYDQPKKLAAADGLSTADILKVGREKVETAAEDAY